MRKQFSIVIVSLFTLFIFSVHGVFAAGATIGVSPNSGSIGKQTKVNVTVTSQGAKFNAAEANVQLSSNLAVQDLSLGNCNLSFLRTPTIQDPSFAGVIVSNSSSNCTVYTLTVIPTKKGHASITFYKGSVKEFGTAEEIFSSFENGSFTNTAALKSSILGAGTKNTSRPGLYTLYLKVYSSGETPATNAQVTLTSASNKNKQLATTDNTGIAHYSNLQAGVYDAVVMQGLNKVGETIINVSGSNPVLSLAIDLSSQGNNPLLKVGNILSRIASNPLLLAGVLVVGIVIGVSVALLVIKFINKRKKQKNTS